MIGLLVACLAPILTTIGLGYAWVKSGRSFDNNTLTPLAADIGMSCLIFTTLAKAVVPPAAFLISGAAAFLCLAALGVIGAALIGAAGLRQRTYLPSVTWGNAGFLGIPIALAAFGEPGLGYAVAFSSVSLAFNSIVTPFIAAGRTNVAAVVRSPLIYAIAAGLTLSLAGVNLPEWLARTTTLIGGMTIPLMLMMVGASMARLKPAAFGRALAFAVLRTAIGAGVGLAVGTLLALNDTARAVLILQCAMPVGVLSYVIAQRWQTDPDEVAALVVVSTWASAVSIPLMLAFILNVA